MYMYQHRLIDVVGLLGNVAAVTISNTVRAWMFFGFSLLEIVVSEKK